MNNNKPNFLTSTKTTNPNNNNTTSTPDITVVPTRAPARSSTNNNNNTLFTPITASNTLLFSKKVTTPSIETPLFDILPSFSSEYLFNPTSLGRSNINPWLHAFRDDRIQTVILYNKLISPLLKEVTPNPILSEHNDLISKALQAKDPLYSLNKIFKLLDVINIYHNLNNNRELYWFQIAQAFTILIKKHPSLKQLSLNNEAINDTVNALHAISDIPKMKAFISQAHPLHHIPLFLSTLLVNEYISHIYDKNEFSAFPDSSIQLLINRIHNPEKYKCIKYIKDSIIPKLPIYNIDHELELDKTSTTTPINAEAFTEWMRFAHILFLQTDSALLLTRLKKDFSSLFKKLIELYQSSSLHKIQTSSSIIGCLAPTKVFKYLTDAQNIALIKKLCRLLYNRNVAIQYQSLCAIKHYIQAHDGDLDEENQHLLLRALTDILCEENTDNKLRSIEAIASINNKLFLKPTELESSSIIIKELIQLLENPLTQDTSPIIRVLYYILLCDSNIFLEMDERKNLFNHVKSALRHPDHILQSSGTGLIGILFKSCLNPDLSNDQAKDLLHQLSELLKSQHFQIQRNALKAIKHFLINRTQLNLTELQKQIIFQRILPLINNSNPEIQSATLDALHLLATVNLIPSIFTQDQQKLINYISKLLKQRDLHDSINIFTFLSLLFRNEKITHLAPINAEFIYSSAMDFLNNEDLLHNSTKASENALVIIVRLFEKNLSPLPKSEDITIFFNKIANLLTSHQPSEHVHIHACAVLCSIPFEAQEMQYLKNDSVVQTKIFSSLLEALGYHSEKIRENAKHALDNLAKAGIFPQNSHLL